MASSRPHLRLFPLIGFVLLFSAAGWAQITVTAPAAKVTVHPAPDYATEVLYDRWDMSQRTDLGWRIFNTVELPYSNITNISFSGGIFSATTVPVSSGTNPDTYSDPNITILDSDYPASSGIGKFGSNYKIDADKYTVFAIRMYIEGPLDPNWQFGLLKWSENTIYSGTSHSGTFVARPGWGIYLISIPSLGNINGNPWSGLKDSFMLKPMGQRDRNIQIDWIRLVENGTTYRKTITWTGSSAVDIYLDNDNSSGNGNLGILAKNVTGGSYEFVAGGLAAGNYYVAIAPTGTSTYYYSAGYYAVEEQPIFRIDTPSAEGSDQDFMTVVAGNPWNMNALSDVDHTVNLHNASIQNVNYEDLAGNVFNGNQVYYAEADVPGGSIGDPEVFFLNFFYRGATYKIDTSRYHNLVAKMGVSGVHSTNDGSVARVMYMRTDEHAVGENVSQDIIIRHTNLASGNWVMHKIVADLRTLPLEDGAASPSHSGWTGTIDTFRIDPHEFPDGRSFFFDDVRITSDWRVDTSFQIQWTMEDADTATGATVAFYYDTDRTGYNGTLIQSGISAPAGSGTTTWNTTSVPGGTYYLYAVVNDGYNQNKFYATGPVIVNHSGTPTMALSKTAFTFGAIQNGTATPAEKTSLTNTGTGTLNWTATRSADWISVSPTTGTGPGTISIGIARTNLSLGTYTGTVQVSDPNATNSPQTITVTYNVYGAGGSSAPFGMFEMPADGATVSSSIPVTGWALDDVGLASVKIYRGTDISDRALIGDAVFVEGARLDVAAAYPGYPQNTKAGWGYMMLTNFLPNGDGPYNLLAYATDLEGNEVLLGSKSITVYNAAAILPFGAIDTPTQGGTASGSLFYNFGWVLTPQPNYIPLDGSTLNVWVDGAVLGHPTYGYSRPDIIALFPGYKNPDKAVGVYNLNTTTYTDGVHEIVWSAVDSAGHADGIGSRYFSIQNAPGSPSPASPDAAPTRAVDDIAGMAEDYRSPVFVRRGMDMDAPAELILPDREGLLRISVPEVTRVALYLDEAVSGEREEAMIERGSRILNRNAPTGRYEAYELALGRLQKLPIGASFDPVDGVLYWQPGPAFLGEYAFVIVDTQTRTKKNVIISVGR